MTCAMTGVFLHIQFMSAIEAYVVIQHHVVAIYRPSVLQREMDCVPAVYVMNGVIRATHITSVQVGCVAIRRHVDSMTMQIVRSITAVHVPKMYAHCGVIQQIQISNVTPAYAAI